jgi:hypothetical protein
MESETGDIFILCCGGCTVRRLDPWGSVSTLAGQHGQPGSKNGLGGAAQLNRPFHMAYVARKTMVSDSGTLFVADNGGSVRAVSTGTGQVTSLESVNLGRLFGITAGTTPEGRLCLYVTDDDGLHVFNQVAEGGEWSDVVCLCLWEEAGTQSGHTNLSSPFHSCLSPDGKKLLLAFNKDHMVG